MKKNIFSFLCVIYGIVMLFLLIFRMANFSYPFWVYEDLVEPYIGTNIINGLVDLLFFTYWSLILFATWLIVYNAAKLTNNTKVITFCLNKRLMTVITCNQITTMLIYTINQIMTQGDFGYYGNYPSSWWSLIENIVVHYVFTLSSLWIYCKQFPKNKMLFKDTLYVLIIPVIYMITTTIVCNTCLPIRWYPYPIFAPDTLWNTIFGSMANYNAVLAWIMLPISYILIIILFLLVSLILKTIHNNNYNKSTKVDTNDKEIYQTL